MSSRALRRAQRELEEKQILEKAAHEQQDDDSEEEVTAKPTARPSLFALLDNDDGADKQDVELEPEGFADQTDAEAAPTSKTSKKNKKKKKKGKGKAGTADTEQNTTSTKSSLGLDEIDQALFALNLSSLGQSGIGSDKQDSAISEEKKQLFSVLSIDTQHLHAANEMKKLFGRAALQNNDEEARPRLRGLQGGIAGALAGRNPPGNRNLASLGLRRNIFIQGKEEWPRATSGGLGMEVVEKRADGTAEYKFVHSSMYRDVQRQFQVCVGSMDPERMIQLLHLNPYHISTLLQVSEIAKQQRDNANAADLLERALFTFGRSIHSTFSANLAAGRIRLDFRRPENREFWLAIWRYIVTLGVRATWRTALEWAKLLIALDPEQDPYCIRLLIDQLALRGREPQAVVDIVESDYLQRLWKVPPNLAFSVAIAYDRLKQPQKARSSLRNAIQQYPWLAARLCRELDITPIPKPVWGKEPQGDYQELLCQLYTVKAKDLWNTTEGTGLLVEVCYSFEGELGAGEDPYWLAQIPEIDLARHVILLDDTNLMSLLDTRIKSDYTSVSDPLPPSYSLSSYDTAAGSGPQRERDPAVLDALLAEFEEHQEYIHNVLRHNLRPDDLTEENLIIAVEQAGSSMEEFRRNTVRFQHVQMLMEGEGVRLLFNGEQQETDE